LGEAPIFLNFGILVGFSLKTQLLLMIKAAKGGFAKHSGELCLEEAHQGYEMDRPWVLSLRAQELDGVKGTG
jgi:hypothetical protein